MHRWWHGLVVAATLLGGMVADGPVAAWERTGHRWMVTATLAALQGTAARRMAPWEPRLLAQCMAADDRAASDRSERIRHFLDLETLGLPPVDVTRRWDEPDTRQPTVAALLARARDPAIKRDVMATGMLPTAVEQTYASLVAALAAGREGVAVAQAADLLHYMADAHQPLHASVSYNGVAPFQKSVHAWFEGELLVRCPQSRPRRARRGSALPPGMLAMTALVESHTLASRVLAADLGCPWTGKPRQAVCRPKVPGRRASPARVGCAHLQDVIRSRLELAAGRAAVLLEAAVEEAHVR